MPFEVRVYSEEYEKRWQALLARSGNATIFHDLRFLSYHPVGKYRTSHLVFLEGDRMVSALPAAIESAGGVNVLRSPCGASWGGLLLPAEHGAEEVHSLVTAMTAFLPELGVSRIEITLPPVVHLEVQDQVQEYALLSAGFRMVKGEITEVIRLAQFDEEALPSSYRRGARKASKEGVTVSRSGDLGAFHEILRGDRNAKHVEPTHSLADLERIRELFPDRVVLFTAGADGGVIGGVLLFVTGKKTVLNMYLCQLPDAKSTRVANLLMYESAVWARDEGFAYLDLGTSSIGMVPNWGLTRFKEGFLGRGFIRPTLVFDRELE